MKSKLLLYLKIFIISLLIIITYYKTFIWMEDRWGKPGSYYSHGYLIPFITAFLIWRIRGCFKGVEYSSSILGIVLLGTGIFVQIASTFMRISFASAFSFILVSLGVVFYLFGKKVGKKFLFPILFLIHMIPLPLSAIADLSLKLKLFAAKCAMSIVYVIGIPAVQDGSKLIFTDCSLVVGDVCSGLKSLIALIAFGTLYAHMSGVSNYAKPILFLASVPAAIIANIMRILVLCLVANKWGSEVATGWVHDVTGLLIFGIAFIFMFGFGNSLERFDKLLIQNANRDQK